MKQETNHVNCPKCGTEINVNEILFIQIQKEAQLEIQEKIVDLNNEKTALYEMKNHLQESIDKNVNEKLKLERLKLEKKIRDQVTEEKSGEIQSVHEQLQEKIKEAKEFNRMKADFIKLKRDKDELKEKLEAESEQKLTEILLEEKKKIRLEVEQKSELKISEKEHVINQLREQLKEAQRKADQGSMQLQGETMELELEKLIRTTFPFDEVAEIAKGTSGVDLLFTIRNLRQQSCGMIAIESKRTKSFSNSWIDKLKSDMRNHKADIAILVTEVMPKNMDHFGNRDGVWICTYHEMIPLLYVLRESLLNIQEVKAANENKTDKVSLLYAYFTSSEFANQIQTIVEGFTKLKSNLEHEKKSMIKLWKEREKSIDGVVQATIEMYGSIKGVAGSSVKTISALELPITHGE